MSAESLADRFWSKVERTTGGCWDWLGSLRPNGYGYIRFSGDTFVAHRLSFELTGHSIPSGAVIDHLCRNRRCVNPDHLEPVENRENVLRGVGPTAVNSKKTHCSRGHRFTRENTYLWASRDGSQHRQCRECQRQMGRERRARRSAAIGEAS